MVAVGAGLCRIRHGADDRVDVAPAIESGHPRRVRRDERIEHGLLAGGRLAEGDDPADSRLECGQQDLARAIGRPSAATIAPPARMNAVP